MNCGGGSCSEAEIVPLHSSLGDRVRLCLKKEKKRKKNKDYRKYLRGLHPYLVSMSVTRD